jgi:hypothetical protein
MIAIILVLLCDAGIHAATAQNIFGIFINQTPNCPDPSLERIFSGFLCEYEKLINQIMNTVYTGMLDLLEAPFLAAMSLFVACMGIVFMTGMVPFSIRDFTLMLFKMCLVLSFGLNPEFLIGYLYTGIVTFAQGSTDAVLRVLAPNQGSIQGIFVWIDEMFFQFIRNQGDAATADPNNPNALCNNNILALLFGLAVFMPPVFGIMSYVLLQLAFAFLKTIMSYVIAMTGIMFLTSMAPLFFMFALFKFTSQYFENWLKYLAGFAIQIFIVFAFVGFVISMLTSENVRVRINTILDMVQPYEQTIQHDGHSLGFQGWCSVCIQAGGTRSTACNGESLSPTSVASGAVTDFIQLIGTDIFFLGIMAYLMHTLLIAAPELSRSLTQLHHAPSFSGELPMRGQPGGKQTSNTSRNTQTPPQNNIISHIGNLVNPPRS